MNASKLIAALVLALGGIAAQALHAQAAADLKGEVLEARDVDSYTYLRLKTGQGEVWAAVPKSAVKKGDKVTVGASMTMHDFESKTLGRKFDKIVFGNLVGAGAGAGSAAPAAPHGGPPAAMAVAAVAKASGPGAKTVAEVVEGKSALQGKTVLVRGQVVKASLGIMGKNWLHLRDGSGSAADGSNDILVTSKDKAAVGDVVTASGTVHTDVNIGAGYAYPVLIEDAALRK